MATLAGYSSKQWKIASVVFAVGCVGLCVLWVSGSSPEDRLREQDQRAFGGTKIAASGAALLNCQRAIKAASRDPATAVVPNIEPLREGADFRFHWVGAQQVRLRNGLGNEVATTALCVVDDKTRAIKLLTLDGTALIAPHL